MTEFLARRERFALVASTNDVVRDWLAAGTPEVCLAVADEQSAGRGRDGRSWTAPAGAALLLSLGFRPAWLAADRVWRLAAVISLAMADASEAVADLAPGTIRLKWPNDLVAETPEVRKLAGVLGETTGLGGGDPRVVVGLGIDTDWAAADFPPELAGSMTSLRELAGARAIDEAALLDVFLSRLEIAIDALRAGRFDADAWSARQLTTGRDVDLVGPDGTTETVRALGVDPATGALLVADDRQPSGQRPVVVGEIRHVQLATPATVTRAGV